MSRAVRRISELGYGWRERDHNDVWCLHVSDKGRAELKHTRDLKERP